MTMDEKERIRQLTALLKEASRAYYTENREIMSNFEYDALYDELEKLENKTGFVLADSPTRRVGYETAKELLKEAHASPMLSLDKTKDPQVLKDFLKGKKGLLSWKLDGLTIVLTYEGGSLVKAVTRGDGMIGEVVTANARTFLNLPQQIAYKGSLTLRGEAVIHYSDFKRINEQIPETDAKYKNPRNLCSGAVRQLNPRVTAERSVRFYAFFLEASDVDFSNSNEKKFLWLKEQGFEVVPYRTVLPDTIGQAVLAFEKEIADFDVPSDGLVLLIDDIEYGKSLGATAKFPKHSIAFKWKDEIAETRLLAVEWSPSRTGLINPVAIFEPVELEGTTVSRASLHNLSICEDLQLGIGDTITVYKANMIIPQIAENLTKKGDLPLPDVCPACGKPVEIHADNGVKTLHCPNPACPSKKIKRFSNYVSRNAMNIEGISEETLEKFTANGFLYDFTDLYKLNRYKDRIVNMYGFGEKSYANIEASVEASRKTTAARLLNALGIANVGASNAKQICKYFQDDFAALMNASRQELLNIEGIGDIIADTVTAYFADETNRKEAEALLSLLQLEKPETAAGQDTLQGMTFVITGSLVHFPNRQALKDEIESRGGRVAGSVSSKTSYLINNDSTSSSGKNKDAKKLGIPVITEEEYLQLFSNMHGMEKEM